MAVPYRAFLDQYVGDLAADLIDAQGVQAPDVAVGGVNVVAAVLLHLARRDDVAGLLFVDSRDRAALRGGSAARAAPAGGKQLNRVGIAGHELGNGLLGGVEVLELRLGAAEPHLVRCRVDQIERDEPGEPLPALRLDHDVGQRAGGRVDDHGPHLAPVPVGAHSVASDHERYQRPASSYKDPSRRYDGAAARSWRRARPRRWPGTARPR